MEIQLDPPVTASFGSRTSRLMREVNTNLRRLSSQFGHADPVAFFCECPVEGCYSVVWMTASDFDATTDDDERWILAAGHQPSRYQ
jgi:hypothetical protein